MNGPPPAWAVPPPQLELTRSCVHIWRVELDKVSTDPGTLLSELAPDEVQRADRLRSESDRRRFVLVRGLLRALLTVYQSSPSEGITFSYNPFGKPSLVSPPDREPLHFNLSHTDNVALYAIARGRRVGVDVEWIDDRDLAPLLGYFLTPHSRLLLAHAAPFEVKRAFYQWWVRREASTKARGGGLSLLGDHHNVAVALDGNALVLSSRDAPTGAGRWSIRDLDIGRQYCGAIAAEGFSWQIKYLQWNGDALPEQVILP